MVSRARGDQLFDIFDRLNPAAGAGAGTVQGGGGAGEIKLTGQRPVLQKSVNKSGVEDVARAGGVQRLHAKGGRVVELEPSQARTPSSPSVAAVRRQP